MIEMKVPAGVEVALERNKATVSGPNGSVEREFRGTTLDLRLEGDKLMIVGKNKAIEHTVRAHFRNMFEGVTEGFRRKMIIRYAHFPMTLEVRGKNIVISNFIGERKPRKTKVHGDAKVEVKGQEVIISGPDKEAVGQTVANIRKTTKIKTHDNRIFQDGIYPVEE
ncbi:50S ribosomal protein L6 [Candidatus Micrarchaeota archaeon]|nr:50S ribosomal protein L6 [Candidatus Micrarchaeota archaeon]